MTAAYGRRVAKSKPEGAKWPGVVLASAEGWRPPIWRIKLSLMRVPLVVCALTFVLLALSCTSQVGEAKPHIAVQKASPNAEQSSSQVAASDPYTFTNELGQQINLADFKGQALALTFIFTRCPMPNYCPRLSKNFAEASKRLSSMTNVPPNWHFFSITIDPEFDTPATLKRYAKSYDYDPAHWSFLTGPADRIQHLGGQFGMAFDPDGNLLKHTFRTVIIDPSYTVQQIIPVAGDFSDEMVQQVLKALASAPSVKEQK